MPSFIMIGLVVFYCGWCKVGDVNFFVIMEACQVAAGHRPDHPTVMQIIYVELNLASDFDTSGGCHFFFNYYQQWGNLLYIRISLTTRENTLVARDGEGFIWGSPFWLVGARVGGSVFAPALPELLWLPTVWRCPYIEIAFSTLDCSIVPTCGAWCSATAAKRGPLKQSWAEIQHSRDDEPLGVLMQMRNVRVNGFFFFSSLGVLPGVLVDTLSLCSGDFCVECVLIVLHKFYIEL